MLCVESLGEGVGAAAVVVRGTKAVNRFEGLRLWWEEVNLLAVGKKDSDLGDGVRDEPLGN